MKLAFLAWITRTNPPEKVNAGDTLGGFFRKPIDFPRNRIGAMISVNDPVLVLATCLPWRELEEATTIKCRR